MREGTHVPEHPNCIEQATHYRESISALHATLMRLNNSSQQQNQVGLLIENSERSISS